MKSKHVIDLLEEGKVLPFGKDYVPRDLVPDIKSFLAERADGMYSGFELLECKRQIASMFEHKITFETLWEFYVSHMVHNTEDFFVGGKELVMRTLDEIHNTDASKIIRYPYVELNDAFGGIFPTTLLVVGADTGCGKSELLGQIVYEAILQGKRVAYFDFENDDGDFIMRRICGAVSEKTGEYFGVKDLRMCSSKSKEFDLVYKEAAKISDQIGDKLIMFNNKNIPTVDDFVKHLSHISKKGVDLVVVDHLHYFQMESGESSAIQLGRVMRELRKVTKTDRIPIVLASHLKQRQGGKEPTNYDLFGSSNIAKESKNVVLMSRDGDETNFALTKNRDGAWIGNLRARWNKITRKFLFN